MDTNPVEKAADAAGNLSALARFLGLTRQRIQQYKRRGWFPEEHAERLAEAFPHLSVEELTKNE